MIEVDAKQDFPCLAYIADTGFMQKGLRREAMLALLEINHLRKQLRSKDRKD